MSFFDNTAASIKRFLTLVGIIADKEGSLRLESHKITDFSGRSEDWPRWKSATKVVFTATGYGEILEDSDYAGRHNAKNRIVYSQLSGALNNGTARHLIERHEETQDGYAAWQEILDWFDGSSVQAALATTTEPPLVARQSWPPRLRSGHSSRPDTLLPRPART